MEVGWCQAAACVPFLLEMEHQRNSKRNSKFSTLQST
jgi:hypothetical protein